MESKTRGRVHTEVGCSHWLKEKTNVFSIKCSLWCMIWIGQPTKPVFKLDYSLILKKKNAFKNFKNLILLILTSLYVKQASRRLWCTELSANQAVVNIEVSFLGHSRIVVSLVSFGVFLTDKDSDGLTPLHAASCSGQLAIVRYLLTLLEEVKRLLMILLYEELSELKYGETYFKLQGHEKTSWLFWF